MYTGPNIERDGLVFGYDTGYGVADNSTATRFYKGKPVVNMLSYGDDFNSWTKAKNSGSYPTINTKIKEGPIAGTMADRLSLPSDGSYPRIYQNFTPTSTTAHVFSVWLKGETTGQGCFVGAFRNSPWSSPSSTNFNITTEWVKYSFSINPADTTSHQIYIGSHNSHGGKSFLISKAQLAPGTISSPFTNGTRSSTDALIDLTRTTTIDVANVSFDSTGQPTFDGTDDKIDITFPTLNSSFGSIEVIVARKDTTTNSFIFSSVGGSTNRYYLRHAGSTSYDACRGNPLSNASFGTMTQDKFYHLVMTWNANTIYAYTNGELMNTSGYTNPGTSITSGNIGQGPGTHVMADLPVFKIHNQILSATEIKQNFNAYKNRFNI